LSLSIPGADLDPNEIGCDRLAQTMSLYVLVACCDGRHGTSPEKKTLVEVDSHVRGVCECVS
jgi:hypothetical protein